jgi:hypothetical protein
MRHEAFVCGGTRRGVASHPIAKAPQMRPILFTAYAVLGFAAAAGGSAAANSCQAGKLMCPTKMPVGGYCECVAHGVTQDGTVVSTAAPGQRTNATAGGCNINPKAPGCG